METFTQPKITGYRQLTEEEAVLMNEIKAHGVALGQLITKLSGVSTVDERWVAIGTTDLQKGIMSLVRSVARPESF